MDAGAAASALDWWREAGVDTIVGETARDWLKPVPAPAPIAAAGRAAAPAPAERPPETLDEFRAWLMTSAAAGIAAPGAPRTGPAGDPGAGLMVLLDMPGEGDAEAGRLLAGEAGALFDRMMAAIGRGRDTLYLAALSPARTPSGRLPPAAAEPLAGLARRHVALVRPKALLLFGDACARALLGGAVTATRGRWHDLDTSAGPVRTLATYRPDNVLAQRSFRKPTWEDLQRLKEGLEP